MSESTGNNQEMTERGYSTNGSVSGEDRATHVSGDDRATRVSRDDRADHVSVDDRETHVSGDDRIQLTSREMLEQLDHVSGDD